MRYLIVPSDTPQITGFTKAEPANAALAESPSGSVIVSKEQDLQDVEMALLIAVYNRAAREGQGKEITKFADRATAMRRVWPCIEFLARPHISNVAPEPTTTTEEQPTMATTTKSATSKRARKSASGEKPASAPRKRAERPKGDGSKTGRTSSHAGLVITKLVDGNPRREGTHGHNSFALIKNGMTYEQYIAKGGRPVDLAWDVDHKYVKLSKA